MIVNLEDVSTCGREPCEDEWTRTSRGREYVRTLNCEDGWTRHLNVNFVRTRQRGDVNFEDKTLRGRELQGREIVVGVNFEGENRRGRELHFL